MSEGYPRFRWKGMPEPMVKQLKPARAALMRALEVAQDVPFDQEERELLSHSVNEVRKAVGDLERAIPDA